MSSDNKAESCHSRTGAAVFTGTPRRYSTTAPATLDARHKTETIGASGGFFFFWEHMHAREERQENQLNREHADRGFLRGAARDPGSGHTHSRPPQMLVAIQFVLLGNRYGYTERSRICQSTWSHFFFFWSPFFLPRLDVAITKGAGLLAPGKYCLFLFPRNTETCRSTLNHSNRRRLVGRLEKVPGTIRTKTACFC